MVGGAEGQGERKGGEEGQGLGTGIGGGRGQGGRGKLGWEEEGGGAVIGKAGRNCH